MERSDKVELGFDNPWLAMPFLSLYAFPWLFRAPSPRELIMAAIVLPLFMLLFVTGYRNRGRYGLACALGMTVLGVAAVPATLTAAVLFIFAAAMIGRSPPRRIAPILLLALTAGVAVLGVWQKAVLWQWLPVVFLCAMVGYYSYAGASLQLRNAWLVSSRAEAERLAAQAERNRMTRDLHDLLGRSLTLISVKAELADKTLDGDPTRARREIEDIRQSAREALHEIRQVVSDTTRLSLADELGRARSLLATLGIALDAPANLPELPLPVDEALAYITRESITNIVRHAGPCEARVFLEHSHDRVRLVITDTGRNAEASPGHGVSGMRSRAEAIGGHFSMTHDKGTRVEVNLSLEEAAT